MRWNWRRSLQTGQLVWEPPYWTSIILDRHASSSGYSAWNSLKVYLAMTNLPHRYRETASAGATQVTENGASAGRKWTGRPQVIVADDTGLHCEPLTPDRYRHYLPPGHPLFGANRPLSTFQSGLSRLAPSLAL